MTLLRFISFSRNGTLPFINNAYHSPWIPIGNDNVQENRRGGVARLAWVMKLIGPIVILQDLCLFWPRPYMPFKPPFVTSKKPLGRLHTMAGNKPNIWRIIVSQFYNFDTSSRLGRKCFKFDDRFLRLTWYRCRSSGFPCPINQHRYIATTLKMLQ